MKAFEKVFLAGHFVVIVLFVLCGAGLMWMAGSELLHAFQQDVRDTQARFALVLECIGLLTIALVSMELGQTIFEEEVMRDVKVSGPTRVRRYLSRFLVVVVIALSIETLVMTFELGHEDPTKLPYAGAVGLTAAMLLIAWGVFIKFNRLAEDLEPEAMAEAKQEDDQAQ